MLIFNVNKKLNTFTQYKYILKINTEFLYYLQYTMSSIEVREPFKNKFHLLQGDEEDLQEDSDQQQLIRTCRDIKDQLAGLKQESLANFQYWVEKIYKAKMKTNELQLRDKAKDISIEPMEIQHIINRVLIEVCQTHKSLIGDQMRVMLEVQSGEYFYKIDAPSPGVGYYDNFKSEWNSNQGTKIDQSYQVQRQTVNQNYYNYCVWIIYHHFCSLSECNKQICQLAQIIRQNSENLFFRIYKQIENQKSLKEEDLYQFEQLIPKLQPLNKSKSSLGDIKKITNLMEEFELIKINELNVLTITHLIPTAMPKPNNYGIYDNLKETQNPSDLYCHICQFQVAINSIIKQNSQNMRKYTLFLQQFKRATISLRERLSKKNSLQNDMINQIRVSRQRRLNRQIGNGLFLNKQSQEQENDYEKEFKNLHIPKKICQNQKQLKMKQEQHNRKSKDQLIKQGEGNNRTQRKNLNLDHQRIEKKLQLTKRKFDFQFKNTKVESFSHISAKMSENNMKFQMVIKKNQKFKIIENFEEDELTQMPSKFKSSQLKFLQLQQRKIKPNRERGVVESLKKSSQNLTKTTETIERQNQFHNYLKQKKLEKQNQKIKMSMTECAQKNFHEYLQQNKFENEQDDSDGEDAAYLQKMQEQMQIQKNQKKKKKKKKKNKKKKENKQEKGVEGEQQDDKTEIKTNISESSNKRVETKEQKGFFGKKEINEKEQLIIKKLKSLKIDHDNRCGCFEIEDDTLQSMKERLKNVKDEQMKFTKLSRSKTKQKSKRNKIK